MVEWQKVTTPGGGTGARFGTQDQKVFGQTGDMIDWGFNYVVVRTGEASVVVVGEREQNEY